MQYPQYYQRAQSCRLREFAPTGFLVCGGQSLTVSSNQDLFDVIGYTYGGSGTSFNVPDLRGRVVAGQDNMLALPLIV